MSRLVGTITGTITGTIALTLALAGCSSSTAPSGPTPHSLAVHVDSIYSALLAKGTTTDSLIALYVADYVELTPAYGGQQASFTVTTASGTAKWAGFSYEIAKTGTSGDSLFYTIAYSDPSLSQLVVTRIEYAQNGTFENGVALAVDSLMTGAVSSSFSGSSRLTSTGSACSQQSGLAASAAMTAYLAGAACQFATIQDSVQASFPANANLGPLSSISISNVTFKGVRFSAGAASQITPVPLEAPTAGGRIR